LYETPERKDKTYSSGGRLERDKNWYYYYDTKGNLQLKSPFPLHGKEPSKKWQMGCWHYEWQANGMLQSVRRPDGGIVQMEYDALGRRTAKIAGKKITRYLWDGNVLLHEWSYELSQRPKLVVNDVGKVGYDREEPLDNLVTWVYENGSFVPCAKIQNGEHYSIVSDYIGRPVQAYDDKGILVWSTEYDIYGGLRNVKGDRYFVRHRQLGQMEDEELEGLYINWWRFYDSSTGLYISKDRIGLAGNNPNEYAYTRNSNTEVDVFGLDILDEAWKVVTSHMNNSGTTILGHMSDYSKPNFESYIDKAVRRGGNYFDMGNDMWNKVKDAGLDPWTLNEKFLNDAIDRGDKILLNVKKSEIRSGSYLELEIKHLRENGYKWVNQWALVKYK